ncbi:helix-turn-helix domain-containing protein [Kitasatospora sp. NPDC059571]|uniref:helix-turn-helix domain-containing protein n=1 Tax=Kitasatospora sp. NPDC059571 TaxID=3346871 RepID=UPI0036993749
MQNLHTLCMPRRSGCTFEALPHSRVGGQMAVPTAGGREIGAVIRGARAEARMTQGDLGAKCGYSASTVSRVEAGTIRPAPETLLAIAQALGLPPQRLGVVPVQRRADTSCSPMTPPAASVADGVMQAQQEAPVRRRELLAGMAGTAAAALIPSPAAATPAPASGNDLTATLERALYAPDPSGATSATVVEQHLAAARGDFTAARYGHLGQTLPELIGAAEAGRDAAAGVARERAHSTVARAYVLATELALKHHSDIAWATADRALTAARAGGSPVVIGEAARVLAITMRRSGRPSAAVDLLRRTAADLTDQRGAAPHAVAATLLFTAAYTAACDRRRSDALDLMAAADEAIRQLPAGTPAAPLFTVDATPAQRDLYWIGVHNALGTPDEGVPYTARLTAAAMPTAERRARLGTDTARMWHRLGNPRRTFAALCLVEQAAPEEARRPALRALTADLLYSPAPLPGVREFARRTGAAV